MDSVNMVEGPKTYSTPELASSLVWLQILIFKNDALVCKDKLVWTKESNKCTEMLFGSDIHPRIDNTVQRKSINDNFIDRN